MIRVNFDKKNTTTGNTDNSNFFIDAERKTDISYTGNMEFTGVGNSIRLTDSIDGIKNYLAIGGKIAVIGTANNNKTFTIISIAGSLLVTKELILDETVSASLNLTNLYQLRRPTFASITGIPDDGTVFNLLLTPRRILENHLRWLRSSFDHLDAYKLIFKTTEKNKDLVTEDLDGNIVNEKADILVALMGERVYLPYFTTFEIKSPTNLLELMTNNNSGKFDYSMGGVAMDGFPIDIKTEDTHLETQQYKLLQTANNNNLSLINNR